MLPRIIELLGNNDFKVITRWTTNEVRTIDFMKLISKYPEKLKVKILTKETFSTLSYNKESRTLFIPNLLPYKDEKGNVKLGELDFCPDILYASSEVLQ